MNRLSMSTLGLVVTATFFALSSASAQDVFLFELARQDGRYQLANGRNATARQGYDNQPHFTADSSSFLFTSLRGASNDIYEYQIDTGQIRQVTDTADIPEYSPVPSADNTQLTVVRENTSPDQTVWRVERSTGESRWALSSREPIGYYAFNGRGEALLWVRYAFTIELARPDETGTVFITGHAAPSAPKLVPGTNAFTFVHRQVNGEVWIKRLDPETLSVTPVAPVPSGQIDYAWTPDGVLLAGSDSTLLQWVPGTSEEWSPVASLESDAVSRISRMAVSPDGRWIAIVAADPEE